MKLSLYEIETTIRKACVGSGLAFGVAEDIGKACAWLALHQINDITSVLKAITSKNKNPHIVSNNAGYLIFSDAAIAINGPSMIDLLIADHSLKNIQIQNPDSILLLIGLAGISTKHFDLVFNFTFSKGKKISVSDNGVNNMNSIPNTDSIIYLSCQSKKTMPSKVKTSFKGSEINSSEWKQIENLAAKTYVPASHTSRSEGAGAGLTDND